MWNFSQKFCTQIGTRHLKATTGSPRPHDCCRLNYISPCDTLVRVCCIQIDAGYLRTMAWGVFRALETVMWYPNVLYGSHLSCLLSKEKYHCTADLQFILFGFSRLAYVELVTDLPVGSNLNQSNRSSPVQWYFPSFY